jgi:hypothetical protein
MMKISFHILLVLFLVTIPKLPAQTPGFYEISRLPFTSDRYDEFAPVFYNRGLVYTTNKRTGFLISRMSTEGEKLFNIYYTDKSEPGRWKNPSVFSKSLRSNYHDGPVSFSTDGSLIFFTRNIQGGKNETSKLGIFMAENSAGEWINKRPFPHNSNNYNVSHPSISADGKTLYFASDMPGGFGGMDLYASHRQGSGWSSPVNLGAMINSSNDEVFPYIHSTGRLYYSSDNNINGSLDLYYCNPGENGRQRPVRLPGPINSEADDFGFIASPDLRSGYFSSSREGTDNIYSFGSTFPVFTQCDSIQIDGLCFEFYEQRAENLDTTNFHLEWNMGDGTRIRGLVADHCFKEHGTYHVTLDFVNITTGEIESGVADYLFTTPRTQQPFITSADTVSVGMMINFDASETYLGNFEPEGYYWETGDGAQYEGNIINHYYTETGLYRVTLGVRSGPASRQEQRKACVYKYVFVAADGMP